MGISVRTKFSSPSEFECDSNALIFNPIGHELSELHESYKMHPEMEVFRPKHTQHRSHPIPDEIWKLFFSQKGMYKRYLPKYSIEFSIPIDRTMIDF